MLNFKCSTSQEVSSRKFYVRVLSKVEIRHQPLDGGNLEAMEFNRTSDGVRVDTLAVVLTDSEGFVLPSIRLVRLTINDINPALGISPGNAFCVCGGVGCFDLPAVAGVVEFAGLFSTSPALIRQVVVNATQVFQSVIAYSQSYEVSALPPLLITPADSDINSFTPIQAVAGKSFIVEARIVDKYSRPALAGTSVTIELICPGPLACDGSVSELPTLHLLARTGPDPGTGLVVFNVSATRAGHSNLQLRIYSQTVSTAGTDLEALIDFSVVPNNVSTVTFPLLGFPLLEGCELDQDCLLPDLLLKDAMGNVHVDQVWVQITLLNSRGGAVAFASGLDLLVPRAHCDADSCMVRSDDGRVDLETIAPTTAGIYRLRFHVGYATAYYDFAVLPRLKLQSDLFEFETSAGSTIVNLGKSKSSVVLMKTVDVSSLDHYALASEISGLTVSSSVQLVMGVQGAQATSQLSLLRGGNCASRDFPECMVCGFTNTVDSQCSLPSGCTGGCGLTEISSEVDRLKAKEYCLKRPACTHYSGAQGHLDFCSKPCGYIYDGAANFTDLSITVAGQYRLKFESLEFDYFANPGNAVSGVGNRLLASQAVGYSSSFYISPGPMTHLQLKVQPSDGTLSASTSGLKVSLPLSRQPQIAPIDQYENGVSDIDVTVSLSIKDKGEIDLGTLCYPIRQLVFRVVGTTEKRSNDWMAGGRAIFTDLYIETEEDSDTAFQLEFSATSDGVTAVLTSDVFFVTNAASLKLSQEPVFESLFDGQQKRRLKAGGTITSLITLHESGSGAGLVTNTSSSMVMQVLQEIPSDGFEKIYKVVMELSSEPGDGSDADVGQYGFGPTPMKVTANSLFLRFSFLDFSIDSAFFEVYAGASHQLLMTEKATNLDVYTTMKPSPRVRILDVYSNDVMLVQPRDRMTVTLIVCLGIETAHGCQIDSMEKKRYMKACLMVL